MTEVFIRKQEIRPGKTERLRNYIREVTEAVKDDEQGVRDIWEAETLQTISLFIEHGEEANYLVWFLEADSIKQLIEARQSSTHPLHDVEDAMMDEVLIEPEETGDFEPLLHGTSADRPHSFEIRQYIANS
jgi:hypothetical protein